MPQIVRELDNLSHISWVFTAYLLASTITVPIYGKLSDLYGRRRLYFIAVTIFLIASAMAGISHNMFELIAFRALQGIGGGAIMVNSIAMIGDLFPPRERGKWQGLIGAVFGVASIAGPLLGGLLTDWLSWRAVFYINLPLGAVAIAVVAFKHPPEQKRSHNRSVDYWGACSLAAALLPFMLLLVQIGDEQLTATLPTWMLLICTLVFATLFITLEKRVKEPIIALDHFQQRIFLVPISVAFFASIGMFGAIVFVPLFAQRVLGVTGTHAGFMLTPLMLGMITASFATGRYIAAKGRYKILALMGMGILTMGMLSFSMLHAQEQAWLLALKMMLTGIGLGMTMPIFNVVVQNAAQPHRLGESTALLQLSRNVGGTLGVAFLGAILNYYVKLDLTLATNRVFQVACMLELAGFLITFWLPEQVLRRHHADHMGKQLEAELGQMDASREPNIV